MEEEQEVGRNTPEEKKGKATKRDDTIDVELASEFDIGFRFPPKAKGSAPKMDGDESQGVGKHQKREQVADSWNREKRRRELTQTTRTHDFEISVGICIVVYRFGTYCKRSRMMTIMVMMRMTTKTMTFR